MQRAVELAPQGCVAIDVGANGADWTLALARRIGPSGHIYAFEAHPYYAEATRKAIGSLGLLNVTLYPVAVGERPGTVQLLVKERRSASFTGRAHIVKDVARDKGTIESVPMVRIDDVMAEQGAVGKVGFLKSDTEGFELAVLRGAVKTIEASRPVLFIEVGHGWMHGYSDHDLDYFLRDLAYRIYAFDQRANRLVPLDSVASTATEFGRNRFLVPNASVHQIE
jgi:FkbM family methyltransferase